MAGLIVLAFVVGWLIFSGVIASGIARAIAPQSIRELSAILLYPLVVAVPFADEAVGRWQFKRLCEREAKVWVAPTANQVQAARRVGPHFIDRDGLVIPVREQPIVYVDAHTGQPFYTVKAFQTPGGMIMRAGLNMGSSTACWPPKWSSRENGIEIDKLLKQGEALSGKQR
jgi:hypothetical protein